MTFVRQQDIIGFQIAMHDFVFVQIIQSQCNFTDIEQCHLLIKETIDTEKLNNINNLKLSVILNVQYLFICQVEIYKEQIFNKRGTIIESSNIN